jgi:PRC-barrel domain
VDLIGETVKQLRRIREVTDLTLQALDGDIGAAQELYVDDHSWTVRYLVVKTGGWLLGRQVLIPPIAFGKINDANRTLRINLTKEQIEHSPPVDEAKPLSREYEEAYYRHFRWAPYWEPGPVPWTSAVPYPATPPMNIDTALLAPPPKHPHLRSSKEVTGYRIHARDGEIGHVEDLVVDDADWVVRYVEVDTKNWLPGKKVLVQTARIDHISWAEQTVAVTLTRRSIESAPAYDPSQLITPDYEVALFKHYGKSIAA